MARAFPVSPALASVLGNAGAARAMGNISAQERKTSGLIFDEAKFIKRMEDHGVRVTQEVLGEMRNFMAQVERNAKKRAPVEFGYLRASIWWRLGRQGNQMIGELGSSSGYGKYTEFVDKGSTSKHSIYQAAKRNPGGYQGAGTVQNPFTWWPAKSGNNSKGQASASRETMPWARPAIVETFKSVLHRRLIRAIKRAQRGF